MVLLDRLQAAFPSGHAGAALVGKLAALASGKGDRAQVGRMALTAFVIRVFSAAIAYVSQVLMARWMGGFEYGVFVSVWVWVLVLGGLSSLGFTLSIIRFVPEYTERGEGDLLRGVVFGSRVFVVALATGLAGAGALGAWAFGNLIDAHYLTPLYLAFVCLPLYALTGIQDGMARPFNWMDLALAPPYLWRPLLIIAGMGTAYALGADIDAATAMTSAIVATWVAGLVQLALFEKRLRARVAPGPRRYDFPFWIKTSIPLFVFEIFYLLFTNTDIIALSWHVSPDQVAIYFAAAKTLALVSFVHFAVGAAFSHKVAQYNATGERDRLQAVVRDAVAWTFWPSLLGAVVMLAMGRPLLWLFGPGFVDGYPIMAILVLGLLARASVGPADRILAMMGQQHACAAVYGVTFAFALVMNLVLIPLFGLYGAASAMALAIGLEAALLCEATRRRTGLRVSIRSTFRGRTA